MEIWQRESCVLFLLDKLMFIIVSLIRLQSFHSVRGLLEMKYGNPSRFIFFEPLSGRMYTNMLRMKDELIGCWFWRNCLWSLWLYVYFADPGSLLIKNKINSSFYSGNLSAPNCILKNKYIWRFWVFNFKSTSQKSSKILISLYCVFRNVRTKMDPVGVVGRICRCEHFFGCFFFLA